MSFSEPVSFFLPTRKGSERIVNKNTKPFAGIEGGIFALKLQQLIRSRLVDEIVISSNDEICLTIGTDFQKLDSRIKVTERPQHLCESSTKLTDFIRYVPTVAAGKHILWGHVTTPLADGVDYDKGVAAYFENLKNGYDSLISVMPLQNFLLNEEGVVINNQQQALRWPRTQDLQPVYEVNHVMFIASKQNYIDNGDRVGKRPYLYHMNKVQSLDVDWEEDFIIAEAVYEKTYRL